MKKYINGRCIDLTPEEIAEIEARRSGQPEPTPEERLEALEAAFMEFVSEVLDNG